MRLAKSSPISRNRSRVRPGTGSRQANPASGRLSQRCTSAFTRAMSAGSDPSDSVSQGSAKGRAGSGGIWSSWGKDWPGWRVAAGRASPMALRTRVQASRADAASNARPSVAIRISLSRSPSSGSSQVVIFAPGRGFPLLSNRYPKNSRSSSVGVCVFGTGSEVKESRCGLGRKTGVDWMDGE